MPQPQVQNSDTLKALSPVELQQALFQSHTLIQFPPVTTDLSCGVLPSAVPQARVQNSDTLKALSTAVTTSVGKPEQVGVGKGGLSSTEAFTFCTLWVMVGWQEVGR